jgi:2-methylisocitrate lyase-like PEP mutase family enzyme
MSTTTITTAETKAKAERLRALSADSALLLPNAWDAASAAVIVAAGATAVATTSGGVSWSLGFGDGEQASRDVMVEAARRIVAAVDVPVTVDAEGGYGPSPEDVAETVRALIQVGAAGVNLEDSLAPGGPLFPVEEQAARLAAARSAADAAGVPEFVINARTDVFLFGIGEPEGRLDDVLARTAAYVAAGADGVFVPGLVDLSALRTLCAESPVPVNVMAFPGAPSVAEFIAAGARRISVGTGAAQAAYTAARAVALELFADGTYATQEGTLGFGELNALFAKKS